MSTPENNRYLCFSLSAEEYAVPLLSVREVIGVPDFTPVPYTPTYFAGIMNLRGQVISCIDLRTKLGIKPKNGDENAVIICDVGTASIGIIVDSVNSVLAPKIEDISIPPEVDSKKNTDYILGVYRKGNNLVLLIEIAKALDAEDWTALKSNQVKAA